MLEDIELEEVADGVYAPVSDRPRPQRKAKTIKKKNRATDKTPVKIQPRVSKQGVHFVQGEEAVTQFMSGFNMVVRIIGGIK